jgi:hypothetical protein
MEPDIFCLFLTGLVFTLVSLFPSVLLQRLLPDRNRTSRGQMGIVRLGIFYYGKFSSYITYGQK